MVDVSVQEIVEAMQAHGGELHGDGSIRVARIAALEHATADSISFLSNPRFADLLDSTPVACLIVAPAMLDAASKPGRACSSPSWMATPACICCSNAWARKPSPNRAAWWMPLSTR